ncbi:MAG: hypothetical protein JWP01_1214 [Myxococcales bacterium]|nr:hypothetical protein [Myxococcales bacterium]
MRIDAAQFTKILYAVYERFEPTYRESGGKLSPADAELIIAIAQSTIAADRIDDPDERELFEDIAKHLYAHAEVETSPPTIGPVEDEEQRLDHLRSHAAQLKGKSSGALAYAVAYVLAVSDMEIAPSESDALEILREALGLDEAKAEDMLPAVSALLAPDSED